MNTFPAASTATLRGNDSCTNVALPSPDQPLFPFPATVEITPLTTSRTRALAKSAMYSWPLGVTATPVGAFSLASVAGPPSPPYPESALPAMVEMMPVTVTRRTRDAPESAMYRLKAASRATPAGADSCARVAGPPSPAKPYTPVPAAVPITPVLLLYSRTLLLPRSATHTQPPLTASEAG